MMTLVVQTQGPVASEQFYQTKPDVNGGPNRSMTPIDLTATFPGIVQTANGGYTGEDAVTGSWHATGLPVHLGENGWMAGQSGCVVDGQEQLQNGGAGIDMPDLDWCSVNDWLDRNRVLAVAALVGLYFGTRGAARRIRERRARR